MISSSQGNKENSASKRRATGEKHDDKSYWIRFMTKTGFLSIMPLTPDQRQLCVHLG